MCQQEPYHYFAGRLSTDPADLRNGCKSNPRRIILQYGLDPGTGAVTPEKVRQIYATLAKPVQELEDYIEEIPEVYVYFSQMADQVPSSADVGEAPTFSSGRSGYVSGVKMNLKNKHVDEGNEIGMFRFGGSSHSLAFNP